MLNRRIYSSYILGGYTTVEIKGQQLRIRVRPIPKFKTEWVTNDVGRKGRLMYVAYRDRDGVFRIQSWRMNLSDYVSHKDAMNELNKIKKNFTKTQFNKAKKLINLWFKKK